MKADEHAFEDAIEAALLAAGYLKSLPSHFDPVLGLDTAELFAFIGATQITEWERLLGRYGNDPDAAQRGFAKRLAAELDARGTVEVLRQGVVDLGVTIRLAFFQPAHGLTPVLRELYAANRVSATRQLAYEPGSTKTLDLVLLVNGIPTATAELKNPLTNQSVEHAIAQYRSDRDPANVTLARRALVHFAVDPDRVAMTTKLAGQTTQFLPFNLGHAGGAGHPPNPAGHRTAYLWQRVWARDAWMDLLARFVHVERPTHGSPAARRAAERVVFPRFHQWDAVLALETHARGHGAGHSYLVEHSAGSGKSNTIAWTAHRLSSLHDDSDQKVFDKVVVITDRVILDRQLQDTIYQFEHTRGVVVKIDKDSAQLAEALAGEQARIIVTTLQKFPVVLDKIAGLPARRYAVIVDEAHSSQTGEAAKDLRLVLGATEEAELTAAEAEDAGFIAEAIDPVEEALAKAVGARGRQENLSFFAFTATPKARTLGRFIPEAQTAERFATSDYQVLIVAEKFQTGFDQPLLHTMYVDKVLTGLNAVQTLSRLNRIHPDKADTFVLDFRNETEDIVKAFEPYYGRTVAPPTDPNLLFDTRRRLDDFDVLRPEEIEATVALLLAGDTKSHGKVYAALEPAVERFTSLVEEDRLAFKDALDKFVRTYSFLSQVVAFGDSKLERDYTCCRALAARLRDATSVERLDLGTEVELTHLKTEMTFEGSLALDADAGEVKTIFGEGRGRQSDPQLEHLSEIVDELNERFGLNLDERDQLLFDQFEETWAADPDVVDQARSNTLENFRLVFDHRFLDTVVSRMDENEAIFKRILDDEEFRQVLMDLYAGRVYRKARRLLEEQ